MTPRTKPLAPLAASEARACAKSVSIAGRGGMCRKLRELRSIGHERPAKVPAITVIEAAIGTFGNLSEREIAAALELYAESQP